MSYILESSPRTNTIVQTMIKTKYFKRRKRIPESVLLVASLVSLTLQYTKPISASAQNVGKSILSYRTASNNQVLNDHGQGFEYTPIYDKISTISTPPDGSTTLEVSNELRYGKPSDSLPELLHKNFLQHPDTPSTMIANWRVMSLVENDLEIDKPSFNLGKLKRHKDSNNKDWWKKVPTKSPAYWREYEQGERAKKRSRADKLQPKSIILTRPTVYIQQPNDQNAIFKARNQLIAIREQHRQLTTKAVDQLVKLDEKLVEGYRTCLKRDMPLYAGMLYRTRDFVTKLGRDVKQHRLILEAWAEKAQNIIKQSARNNTLVREYNGLIEKNSLYRQVPTEKPKLHTDKYQVMKNGNVETELLYRNYQQLDSTSDYIANKNKFVGQNLMGKRLDNYVKKYKDEIDVEWVYKAPKLRYTTSLNEVHLSRDLQKSQELIDRIEKAHREISNIVDDILFLSKFEGAFSERKKNSLLGGRIGVLNSFRSSSGENPAEISTVKDTTQHNPQAQFYFGTKNIHKPQSGPYS